MLSTPVLFLIYNRPEPTRQVFERIRQAQPRQLFVAADGPKLDVEGDEAACAAAREVVSKIDWECDVQTLFRGRNLGCKRGVSQAIDWFFQHVEEGIILEDDCVPDPTFFGFCGQLLGQYRSDSRVMMIAGTNYVPPGHVEPYPESYFFANYYPIWGWATWRRAWQYYDVTMKPWESFKLKADIDWQFAHREIADYYRYMFDLIESGFDTWDIQWWFACIFQHGLCAIPRSNLISNIGATGTHSSTQQDFAIGLPTEPLSLEAIRHPTHIYPDRRLNTWLYRLSHAQLAIADAKPGTKESASLLRRSGLQRAKKFLRSLIPPASRDKSQMPGEERFDQ